MALAQIFNETTIKREDIFLTSKVWSNNHTKNRTLASVERSLSKLGVDYLDLVLVHWPFSFQVGGEYLPIVIENGSMKYAPESEANFKNAYLGLECALERKLVRSIGISNFNISQIGRLLEATNVRPVVNQVESHPLLNQKVLLDYCDKQNITLVAYSPLRKGDKRLLDSDILKPIAASHNKTVAQVILRWQVQRQVVVIPKTTKQSRMVENRSLFDFTLTEKEIEQINKIDPGDGSGRLIQFDTAKDAKEYPF